MRIIVDGYNFIGREKGLRGDLKPKRRRLMDRCIRYVKESGHAVVVVFDGRPDEETVREEVQRGKEGGVEVLYAGHGKIADTLIAALAKASIGETTVVSSDRALQRAVREAGVTVLPCGKLEAVLPRHAGPSQEASPARLTRNLGGSLRS